MKGGRRCRFDPIRAGMRETGGGNDELPLGVHRAARDNR